MIFSVRSREPPSYQLELNLIQNGKKNSLSVSPVHGTLLLTSMYILGTVLSKNRYIFTKVFFLDTDDSG